jgi:hypothetical protein
MVKSDPRAEKIRRRKESKRSKPYMTRDTLSTVKLIIRGAQSTPVENPDDKECPRCQALNRQVA